jgi:hypothetical protein
MTQAGFSREAKAATITSLTASPSRKVGQTGAGFDGG